jgi:hypothetical protein
VLGYDASGALVTLRKGTGDLICLADDPKDADFDVACYQKDLDPFMARGRELQAKGVADKERNQMRWKEVDAGTLTMPREPRTLYVLTGTGYDAATSTVTKAIAATSSTFRTRRHSPPGCRRCRSRVDRG